MLPLLLADVWDIIGSVSLSNGPLQAGRYLLATQQPTTNKTATGTQDKTLRNISKPCFTP